ncbi:hypothetical protein [Caballeronia sp. Lep1P3]|uniref:hypothetical protein n=1 Tax=Caballeronia sp. Lep1P3 TaxID=2878150 RepID=UPI001FD2B521|nr:hypothetical protein [Caballeronia sp. Lep1P3]
MKDLHISVDPNGRATMSQTMDIKEHCVGRARLLSSLVNLIAAPGGFEHFCAYPESVRRDILGLLHSTAEEQLPLISALEEHTARASYDRGVQAAREFMVHEQAANSAHHFDADHREPQQLVVAH